MWGKKKYIANYCEKKSTAESCSPFLLISCCPPTRPLELLNTFSNWMLWSSNKRIFAAHSLKSSLRSSSAKIHSSFLIFFSSISCSLFRFSTFGVFHSWFILTARKNSPSPRARPEENLLHPRQTTMMARKNFLHPG